MKKIKILLLMGGGGTEHQVSLNSGQEVLRNFDLEKYEVVSMIIENKNIDIQEIKKNNPDVVFIVIHGSIGEDGTIQKLLEEENIKFVGCGSEASKIGIDKIKFKNLMRKNKLPVAKDLEVVLDQAIDFEKIKFLGRKWVVKPTTQGSSVGVSIVEDINKIGDAIKEAFKYDKKILVEEFIDGVEVSCGVIEENGVIQALPIIEICPKNDFFNYEAKYTEGKCEEIVPARLSDELTKKIQEYSRIIFKLIGGRGFARIDFIIRENNPIILEINTIPGMTPNSLLPKEAEAAGISYKQLLGILIESI